MREITEFDDRRSAEISIIFNNSDQIIGVDIYFCSPILLHNFDLNQIGSIKQCGGCGQKRLSFKSPLVETPDIPHPTITIPPEEV